MQINAIQQKSLNTLMGNVANFSAKYGEISNLMVLSNPKFKNSIFVKYEKQSGVDADRKVEIVVLEIDSDGFVKIISDELNTVYSMYSFLGDCVPIDINNIEII